MSPGILQSGGTWFSSWYVISIDTGHIAQRPQSGPRSSPAFKMEPVLSVSSFNTSKQVLFLPPSDVYVRSFLYLFYTLIKLYYTKVLSDQASSLTLDWIPFLRRPRIPASLRDSATNLSVFPILLFSSISLCWSLRKAFLLLFAFLWYSAFS